jgi:hypothetical protein
MFRKTSLSHLQCDLRNRKVAGEGPADGWAFPPSYLAINVSLGASLTTSLAWYVCVKNIYSGGIHILGANNNRRRCSLLRSPCFLT